MPPSSSSIITSAIIHDEESSPLPPPYSEQQPHQRQQQRNEINNLTPYFPSSDFELPEGQIGITRRRSTVQPGAPRPRPEFILPDFPTPAKQGRPTLVRELSSGLTTPITQTPYTQTPISTRPPSPEPLIPVEFDENPSETRTENGRIKSWRGSFILMTTCGAQLMDNIFMTSINMAAPTIQTEFSITAANLQWLISAYTLTFGGFLLLAGMLSDRYGRRNMFCLGMAWLSIWTLACGFAQSLITLAIFRALQGIGAALTVPSAVGIVSTYFRARDRTMGLNMFGASGAVGFAVGLIFGGLLTGSLGWRYIFRISVAITGPIGLLGYLVLPPDVITRASSKPRPRLDYLGAGVSTAGLILLSFVLSGGGVYGWKSAFIIVLLIVSVGLLVTFAYVEKKVANPIMPLYLWKLPNFAAVWVAGFVAYGSYQTLVYYMTLVAQDVERLSPSETAVRLLPMGATGFFTNFVMIALLNSRIDVRLLLLTGLAMSAFAPLPSTLMHSGATDFWRHTFPTSVIGVAGISVCYTTINVVMIAAVPPELKSLVGGIINTSFQLGSSLGLAIASAVVQAVAGGEDTLKAFQTGLWVCCALAATGMVGVVLGVRKQRGVVHAEVVH